MIIIASRRPGGVWNFRNRFDAENAEVQAAVGEGAQPRALARLRLHAERQVRGWIAHEPATQFRILECEDAQRSLAELNAPPAAPPIAEQPEPEQVAA